MIDGTRRLAGISIVVTAIVVAVLVGVLDFARLSEPRSAQTGPRRCFPAIADVHAHRGDPDMNFGGADTMLVESAATREIALAYLRFDPSGIPPEATGISATLKVRLRWLEGDTPATLRVGMHAVTEPWIETRLSWGLQPARDMMFDDPIIEDVPGTKTWKATALVQEWLDGKRENHGMVLVPLGEDGVGARQAGFASKEASDLKPPELCIAWQDPTATATPPGRETETPTPTETEVTRPTFTPTPTSIDRRTETPTSVPDDTRTPTPTSAPVAGWTRLGTDTVPADVDRTRFVRVSPDGSVWLRIADPLGEPDTLVARIDGRWQLYDSIADAIGDRYPQIRREGTVPDLWAVDASGRVWAGPAYHNGTDMIRLADESSGIGGRFALEERALIDRDGNAWVPFTGNVDCPLPTGCRTAGLRAFDAAGDLTIGVTFEPEPDAEIYAVPAARLLPPERVVPREMAMVDADRVPGAEGARGLGGAARGSGIADGDGFASHAIAEGDAWVVTPRFLYSLPDTSPIAYPFLDATGGAARNAGYSTSAAVMPDGRLQVFTWVEAHADRIVSWHAYANTWLDGTWDVWDLTDECPLLDDGAEYVRLTAAAYDADGALWLGSSEGEVAVWRDGAWADHFTPADTPLLPGRPITGITIGEAGAIWFVQPGAVFSLGDGGTLEPTKRILLPFLERGG